MFVTTCMINDSTLATHTCIYCSKIFFRFPHPVTFGGMLEMSVAYLPVNKNWQLYIDRSQAKYDELQSRLSSMLTRLAKEAVKLPKDKFVFACH